MNCDDVQLLMPDYVDGALSPGEAERVRRHLESCPTCAREADAQRRLSAAFAAAPKPMPGPRVQASFATWLEAEREAASLRARELMQPRVSWLRLLMGSGATAVAACVLFAAGLLVGGRVMQPQDNAGADDATMRELARLRDEVAAMNQAVAWTVQGSAADRLQTVLMKTDAAAGSRSVIELLNVVAYDPSPTVRQSAVRALGHAYANDPGVRRAIATALSREPSPLVQLDMIDLLASTRDSVAANALADFAQSETSPAPIRDAASYALTRM